MEGPTSKKTNEPPKRVDHKGNIKFQNPLQSQEAYQIRKWEDLLKGCLAQTKPHILQLHVPKYRFFMHVVMPLTPSIYEMCIKLKEEGFQCFSFPMPCLHIIEEACLLANVDSWKPLQLEGETCVSGIDDDKYHISFKS